MGQYFMHSRPGVQWVEVNIEHPAVVKLEGRFALDVHSCGQ